MNYLTGSKIHIWAPSFREFGGGISAFSSELALGILECGIEPLLFGKHDLGSTIWKGLNSSGTGRVPIRMRTPFFAAMTLAKAIKEKPKQIISTHLNFGPLARFIKRVTGIPYTLVAHGIDVGERMPTARLEALRSADHILAVSHWTRDRILALGGIDPSNVSILPNTYDEERFSSSPARIPTLLERYGIAPHEKVILTVSRLNAEEGYKGYDQILRCLPELRRRCGDVRFLIAGSGGDRPRIEAMAKDIGVTKDVILAGFVPDEELPDLYRLADVFAMPSTGEGFGIVFLEAMACGTPVLAGNRDGSIDALDSGRLGALVDPLSGEQITDGLSALLQGEGPEWWFDRQLLSRELKNTYGRARFKEKIADLIVARQALAERPPNSNPIGC